ncbi:MAG: exopolysaccharide biosynthesis polyprenyl glycosylphosphotransferase [Clostridia bacterium]|nr:exopolysaccharide biosynthesis polyprenyl glycosylphosphotransferase [Clostridia bacterium]
MSARKDNGMTKHLDFLLIDLITLLVSFALSYRIKFGDFGFLKSDTWMPLILIIALVQIVICLFSNPYLHILTRPYYEEILRSLILTFYNLVAASVLFYIFKIGTVFSRQTVLMMFVFYFALSLLLKCLWKWLIKSKKIRPLNAKKTALMIVAPANGAGEIISDAIAGDSDEFELKAVCIDGEGECGIPEGIKTFRGIYNIPAFAAENAIDEVLIAVNPDIIPPAVYDKLIKNDIPLHFSLEPMLGFTSENYAIDSVGVYNTLGVGKYEFTQGQTVYLGVKRVIDILAGLIGMIILLPFTAVIKLAYLLTGDRAKIIYRQSRIGKNGKPIKIYKFRTMIPDADEKLKELLKDEKYRTEWEANQKLADDPRITKIGRFLRKTSIDELPQLINVLKGDMSVVGPRPLVEGELEAHGGMKIYQQVKPGITGWWGCNGRSNISYRERLELEYYYIRNFSVYLDFLCVLRTALTVLTRKGAE